MELGIRQWKRLWQEPARATVWFMKKIVWYHWAIPYYWPEGRWLPPRSVVVWYHRIIMVLAVAAVIKMARKKNWNGLAPAGLILIYSSLAHGLWFGLDRYALPYMFIVILVIGGWAKT